MIICNGHPKSGTHILMQTCNALGFERFPGLLFADRTGKNLIWEVHKQRKDIKRIAEAGNEAYIHAHLTPDSFDAITENNPQHKILYITREYRNQVISWCRWSGKLTEGRLIGVLKRGDGRFGRFGQSHLRFDQWLKRFESESVCGVTFEGYFPRGLVKVCRFLGAQYHCTLSQLIYGRSDTWSGQHSDYRICPQWTPEVEAEYQAALRGDPVTDEPGHVTIQPKPIHINAG